MNKTTLVIVLSVLTVIFLSFFFNVWKNLLSYRSSSGSETVVENSQVEVVKPSFYVDYTKESLESSLSEKNITFLFFTSNWCMECSSQDSVNQIVFDSLESLGLSGLKIHILDSETTIETDALAKKFDVTKENSIVILDKNGAVFFKQSGNISQEQLKQKLEEVFRK